MRGSIIFSVQSDDREQIHSRPHSSGFRCEQGAFLMPRYYFRLTDGAAILENHEGLDLPGNAAARDDAIALARHLKHGDVMQGWNWGGWFINIIDVDGHKVDEVSIMDV
jgi:hypothetical protein